MTLTSIDHGVLASGGPDRAIVALLPMPVLVCTDGAFTFLNRAALQLFGVDDLDDLIERLAAGQLLTASDLARVRSQRDLIRTDPERVQRSDHRIVRLDGTVRDVEWTVRRLGADGCEFLHVLQDVSDLVETRDALAAAEAHQRDIVASLAEGVIVVDAAGVCTDANEAASTILRLPSIDLLVGAPAIAMPVVDAAGGRLDPARHPIRRALVLGERLEHELVHVRFGSRVRAMRVSIKLLERYGLDGPAGAVVTFTDVTAELRAAAALASSEARFRELAARAPVGIFETDPDGSCTYVNHRLCEFTGRSSDGMFGDAWMASIHPDDEERVAQAWRAAVARRQPLVLEYRYRRPDGAETPVHAEASPVLDDAGRPLGWLGTATDLSSQVALREGIERSERRFRELAERSPDLVLRYDLDVGAFEYLSPAARVLMGVLPEAVYLEPGLFHRHVHPDDRTITAQLLRADAPPWCQFRIARPNGKDRVLEARTAIDRRSDGHPAAVEAVIRDATAEADRHRHLDDLAHRDELTGLPNRRALVDRLRHWVAERDAAVLFIDLDGFKQVNDTLGHDAGDEVLVHFARLLEASVRDTDELARLAGDEFVVVTTPSAAAAVAGRVLGRLESSVTLSGGRVASIGASIGVACATRHGEDADDLLQRADAAMYEAKRRGKRQVVVGP